MWPAVAHRPHIHIENRGWWNRPRLSIFSLPYPFAVYALIFSFHCFMTSSFVEVRVPIHVGKCADADSTRCGRMHKHIVFQVYAHMRYFAIAVGEEHHVAFAQFITGNEGYVFLNVGSHAMECNSVGFFENVVHKARAIYPVGGASAIEIGRSKPLVDCGIEFLIVLVG